MDKITRKELKSDKFAQEVEQTVEFVSGHRRQMIMYGGIAAAVIVIVVGVTAYLRYQRGVRQEALTAALEIQQAAVGPQQSEFVKSYPTPQARDEAATKAFNDLAARFSGKDEGMIAEYYLGMMAAEQGKTDQAINLLKDVADRASNDYASLAKLVLADLYAGAGKIADAESTLRSLMNKPSAFVSKEQATIQLAQLIGRKNPAEARKMLEPLRTERSVISQAALTALSQLPAAR